MIRAALMRLAAHARAGMPARPPGEPVPAAVRRLQWWTLLVAGVLIGHVIWLFLLRGHRILDSDGALIVGQLLLGMGVIAIAGLIVSTPRDAIRLSPRVSKWIIIAGAAFLQLLAVLLLWPALSPDITRYRMDGLAWLSGKSPYAAYPRELLATGQFDVVDQTMPWRDARSHYPPVAQTVFITARAIEMATFGRAAFSDSAAIRIENRGAPLAVRRTPAPYIANRKRAASNLERPSELHHSPDSLAAPEQPVHRWREAIGHLPLRHRGLVLRLIFAAAAVGCVGVLLKLLHARRQTPWLAVLFAWNPLVTLEAGGMGHVDIVGVLFILLMLRMLQNQKPTMATLALCLACGVKPMAIILAPLVIRQIMQLRDWQIAQRSIGMVLLILAIVYMPLMSIQRGLDGWIEQLAAHARLHANSTAYSLNNSIFGAEIGTALLLIATPLTAIGVLLWALHRRLGIEDAGYWLMLATLLVSPLVLPWSLLWALCFVPLMRHTFGWGALAWSATAAFAYVLWRRPPGEGLPATILLAEYLPVAVALVIQLKEAAGQFSPVLPPVGATSAA